VRHPAEGVQWINEKDLTSRSVLDNAYIDTRRDLRGVDAILSQTGPSAPVGDYYDKNKGIRDA
jgi:hypothetical protein